jgi:hypothetical protein
MSQQRHISVAVNASGPTTSALPDYWGEKRERIYRWLHDKGAPSFAETYKGAVIILHNRHPGYVRFVCHGVRDIINGLPALLAGLKRPQVQYPKLVDDLENQWDAQKLPRVPPVVGSAEPDPTVKGVFPDLTIPGSLIATVVNLLDEHDAGRVRATENPYRFFEVCAPENKNRRELIAPMVQTWREMQRVFQSNTHESGTSDLLKPADEVARAFRLFEEILSSFATGFYEQMEVLDEILEKANA